MLEDIIREAMERGDFDNLPGKGKPLDLREDPLLDPLTAIVNRIVRDNGCSHPLLEARKMIESEIKECRAELARASRVRQTSTDQNAWLSAIESFRARLKQINRDIRLFNLKAPSPALHNLALDADSEIAKITAASSTQP